MEIKKRVRSNVIIFDIIGDFQRPSVSTGILHQLVKDQLNKGKRNFLVNLENVNNIDYVGVGEILACWISVINLGGKLKLYPQKFFVEKKIPVDSRIGLFDNEEEALKSFSE